MVTLTSVMAERVRLGKLKLKLIQTHMTQKPMLRVEAGARALRMLVKICVVGQKGQVRVCKALVSGRGSLARRSWRDGYVTGRSAFFLWCPPWGVQGATDGSPKIKVKQFMSSSAVGGR